MFGHTVSGRRRPPGGAVSRRLDQPAVRQLQLGPSSHHAGSSSQPSPGARGRFWPGGERGGTLLKDEEEKQKEEQETMKKLLSTVEPSTCESVRQQLHWMWTMSWAISWSGGATMVS